MQVAISLKFCYIEMNMQIVKKCAKNCLQDLCLPQDTRHLFEYFELRIEYYAAGLMWSLLKEVVNKYDDMLKNFTQTFIRFLKNNL